AVSMSAGEQKLLEVLSGMQQTQALLAQMFQQQSAGSSQASAAEFGCKSRDEELVRWATWSWEFEQYLGTLDREYILDFKRLADHPKKEIVFGTLSSAEQDRARIMYGLLASLVNDRLRRVLKTIPHQNGYEGYRQIALDLKPSSRTRALALMTAISSWPLFDQKQGLLSQVVRLEQAMSEYDAIASQSLSDDQKVASLLRCLSGPLMKHVQLVMEDHWTYDTLRALVLRFDAASSKWSSSIAATYGLGEKGGSYTNGPTPMEIDRIGHYKRECRAYQAYLREHPNEAPGARQVQAKAKVNRVSMIDLTAFSPGTSARGSLCAVRFAEHVSSVFDISASDHDAAWTVSPSVLEQKNIRAVTTADLAESDDESSAIDIIIDSGADESCLPAEMAWCGTSLGGATADFADAQGHLLDIMDHRCHEFQEIVPGVWCLSVMSDHFIDVTAAMPTSELPYRTTLIEVEGSWRLAEMSQFVYGLDDPAAALPEVTEPCNCIVFAHEQ
ncbi:unnamed protein product, partial [Symbiodinium necroappetens]